MSETVNDGRRLAWREAGHLLPAARRVTVPGAGHMAPITHPAEVSDAIAAFLAAQDAEEPVDLGRVG
jgi:pimeloyl-ACP methyl ester carboxylesterase